jgi:hypothetical protein
MALLPILFLLTIAAATWVFRDRPARFRWTLFGGAAVITWGAVIGLAAATPSSTALSVWQPGHLFRSRLEFTLDDVSWTMAYVMATNLLVWSAFMASTSRAPTEVPASFMLGLSAVSMAGVMAGNLASLLASWALFDLILLVRRLSSAREVENRASGGLAIFTDLLSLMVILVATATLEDPAASGPISAPPLGLALFTLAGFLRLYGGAHLSMRGADSSGQDLSEGYPRVVSAGLGTSLLLRIVAGGIPADMVGAVQGFSCVLGTYSSVRWISRWRETGSDRYFVTAVVAYGILASSLSATGGERPALAAAALALCVAPLIICRSLHHPVHRMAPIAAGLLVSGLPATPGGTMMGGLVSSFSSPLATVCADTAVLGLGLLAGGLLLHVRQSLEPWPAGEALPKGLFTAGKFVPLLSAAGLSLRLGTSTTVAGVAAFLIAMTVGGVASRVGLRPSPKGSERQRRVPASFYASRGSGLVRGVVLTGLRVFYGLSSMLEGEGAMLWVLVLLMVIVLGWSAA